jgi:hypothetical protein
MGSAFLFYAGPEDQRALIDFIRSLDLHLIPPQADQVYTDDANILRGCWISPVPAHKLHPWGRPGEPQVQYLDVLDPIISFTRSAYRPPYLATGNVYWNNDVPALAAQTKSTFQKIGRWVRKNWLKPVGRDQYFGPQAMRLVFEEGIKATTMVPGVTFNGISVLD